MTMMMIFIVGLQLMARKKYRSKMGQRYSEYIHSKRWHRKLPFFHAFLMHQDCLFPWLPANDIHHLAYWGLGWEVYILHVVPLNRATHDFIGMFDYDPLPIKLLVNTSLRLSCLFWTIVFIPLHCLRLMHFLFKLCQ